MDAETHANVCTYIDYVRGVCAEDNEEALFVTLEGKAFDHSNIGKRITAFWFKAKKKWEETLDYVSCFSLHFFRALAAS